MSKFARHNWLPLPLRVRLTLWYTLSLTLILLLLAVFIYFQMQRSLLAQVDATLQLAATQAALSLDSQAGRLVFQNPSDAAGGPFTTNALAASGTDVAATAPAPASSPTNIGYLPSLFSEISAKSARSRILANAAI